MEIIVASSRKLYINRNPLLAVIWPIDAGCVIIGSVKHSHQVKWIKYPLVGARGSVHKHFGGWEKIITINQHDWYHICYQHITCIWILQNIPQKSNNTVWVSILCFNYSNFYAGNSYHMKLSTQYCTVHNNPPAFSFVMAKYFPFGLNLIHLIGLLKCLWYKILRDFRFIMWRLPSAEKYSKKVIPRTWEELFKKYYYAGYFYAFGNLTFTINCMIINVKCINIHKFKFYEC